MTTFNTRVTFDHVRNSAAGFTSANPVLGYGVTGLETDTGKIKIGDGVAAWSALQYSGGGASSRPAVLQHSITAASNTSLSLAGVDAVALVNVSAGSFTATITLPNGSLTSQQVAINAVIASGTQTIQVKNSGGATLFSFTNASSPSRGALQFIWHGSQWLNAGPQIMYSDAGGGGGGGGGGGNALTDAVAYYSFDGATPLADLSASGLDLTDSGSTSFASSGVLGTYAAFDGTNYLISLTPPAVSAAVSVALWAKSTSEGLALSVGTRNDTGAEGSFRLIVVSGTTLVWQLDGDNNTVGTFTNDGTWQHIAATYDGTTAKLYVNGALVQSEEFANLLLDGTHPLLIGFANYNGGTPSAPCPSDVDELAVYDFALTEAQVLSLYNSGDGFNPYD